MCSTRALGSRPHGAPRTNGVGARGNSVQRANIPKTEALEMGEPETTAGSAREVAEGVAPGVAVIRGIGRFADSNSIEDEDDCALQAVLPT